MIAVEKSGLSVIADDLESCQLLQSASNYTQCIRLLKTTFLITILSTNIYFVSLWPG